MDDILIPSSTVEENLQILKTVLLILKQYSLKLNIEKCLFLKTKIEYLGYVISHEGITLSPRHTEAIQAFPQPTKVVELQRFLGLTNYFCKFIKNYAIVVKPLYKLLRKSSTYNFNNECVDSFNNLKDQLVSFPILRLYNPEAETQLHTDASSIALAAILLQKQANGQFAPVAYFSQATNDAESRYHSLELEMLAIVKSIERFHIYLYGAIFTIVTDCCSSLCTYKG